MPAAIVRIAQARGVAQLLELVEQQHDVVGVHAERVREVLLGALVVVAHVCEGDEVAHVHAEQILVPAPVELLGQARAQHHRPGCAATPTSHVLECTGHCIICHQVSSDYKYFSDHPCNEDDP
jgi:hypothetical protein